MKIAVFDSGIGGITVLRELHRELRDHEFLYYGDTANVPYGTKSPYHIRELVQAAARALQKRGCDALVIACNTAACIALDDCRSILKGIPVFSVVEAGVATISRRLKLNPAQNVVILGTRATIQSRAYSNELKKIHGEAIAVYEQECPLLVPMIEEGWIDHPVLHETLKEYLRAYQSLAPGMIFLACTHYPWIRTAVETLMPKWQVLDSASLVSETLARSDFKSSISEQKGKIEWFFTDPHAKELPTFTRFDLWEVEES